MRHAWVYELIQAASSDPALAATSDAEAATLFVRGLGCQGFLREKLALRDRFDLIIFDARAPSPSVA